LNCVTAHYAQLWTDLFAEPFREDRFAKSDRRLQPWTGLTSTWYPGCALRTDFERRQALVELDAIAALALELTLDELLTVYRVPFPVLHRYEHDDRYDQNGRLVPGEVLKIAKNRSADVNKPGPGIRWSDPTLYPVREREYPPPFT